jgi:3-deoxy-D-manno-octulosonic acid kinase
MGSILFDEQRTADSRGGILYDASRLRKPGHELFEADHWRKQAALQEVGGGRASVAILQAEDGRWLLRHYRRGGWIANLSHDRYLWLGESRTRSFSEWRLLAELRRRGLPVPAPIAARYVRGTFTYRADLITEYLASSRTLADAITGNALSASHWSAVGAVIAAFHREGVHHADLNANNVLLRDGLLRDDPPATPQVYLLDFDRGRIRERGPWENDVLARLKRSLEKIERLRHDVRFGEREWASLLEGYRG